MGIALYSTAPIPVEVYALAAAMLALLGIIFRASRRIALAAVGLSLVAAGLGWAQIHYYYAPEPSAIHRVDESPVIVRVRARIVDQPIVRDGQLKGAKALACRATLLAIEEDHSKWRETSGDVLLRIEPMGELKLTPGDEITAIGDLARLSPPSNPGEYDWQAHFARADVYMRLSVNQWQALHVVSVSAPSVLWRVRLAARKALASGFQNNNNRALAMALLFGDNDEALEEAWSDFRASGTAHHLSISGTHIAILTAFVLLLGRCLMLHPRTVLIAALLFALAYAGLVRPSPPVVRSVLLCLAVGASILLRRNTDPLQCLFAAVLVMLIYSPMDLTNPGFQLSFGAVAGLMLFTRRVSAWAWSLENEHDRMARVIRPPQGIGAAWQWALHAFVRSMAAGLVAYSISLPLIAIHFRQLNPWAVPGSLLLAPIVGCALVTGILKIALCSLIPAAGALSAFPTEAATRAMRWSVGVLAHLPGAEIGMGSVAPWMVGLYALMLLLPLAPYVRSWRLRWVFPCAAVLLFSATPFLCSTREPGTRITFLSVGNGSCAVVEMPDGRVALIDCGAARQRDLFGRTIQPFLRDRNIRRIDAVFITHADSDHALALDDIVAAYHPQIHRETLAGKLPGLSGAVNWEVLAPPIRKHLSSNDESSVVRLKYAGRSILFTGDIEEDGIASLLRGLIPLDSDVLIAPHHGSWEKNTADLLRASQPDLIICSSSPRLSGLQRSFNKLAGGINLKRTGTSGAISITITPQGELIVNGFRDNP